MRQQWYVIHILHLPPLISGHCQPETVITENGDTPTLTTLTSSDTLVNSATGAAGALAGWAISSLGRTVRIFVYPSTPFSL